MTDTPEYVKKLQLELWLLKPPGERLRQFLVSNEQLHAFWKAGREQMAQKYSPSKQKQP